MGAGGDKKNKGGGQPFSSVLSPGFSTVQNEDFLFDADHNDDEDSKIDNEDNNNCNKLDHNDDQKKKTTTNTTPTELRRRKKVDYNKDNHGQPKQLKIISWYFLAHQKYFSFGLPAAVPCCCQVHVHWP